jgi:hypothetical protein
MVEGKCPNCGGELYYDQLGDIYYCFNCDYYAVNSYCPYLRRSIKVPEDCMKVKCKYAHISKNGWHCSWSEEQIGRLIEILKDRGIEVDRQGICWVDDRGEYIEAAVNDRIKVYKKRGE